MEHKLVLIEIQSGVVTDCKVYPATQDGQDKCRKAFQKIMKARGGYSLQEIKDMQGYFSEDDYDLVTWQTQV